MFAHTLRITTHSSLRPLLAPFHPNNLTVKDKGHFNPNPLIKLTAVYQQHISLCDLSATAEFLV